MRIGELARRTGVAERLLRYYEEQALLAPGRTRGGYRVYEEADVALVGRIRCLLASGLSTASIRVLLPCLSDEGEHLAPTCPDALADLVAERRRIDGAIDELQRSRRMLDDVIGAAPASASR